MNTRQKEKQLHRIKSVYVFLKKYGIAKTENLAIEFECTQKTMQRDLSMLKQIKKVKSIRPGIWKAI